MDYEYNNALQAEGYHLQKNLSCADMPESLCVLNKEDLSYMLDENTPVKDCGDLTYPSDHADNSNKESDAQREASSLLKRRRMLQFDTEIMDSPLCFEDISSVFVKSNEREESMQEALAQSSESICAFEDFSAFDYDPLDESSEEMWLAECFNDTNINRSSEDMGIPGASDLLIDISEFCNDSPVSEATVVQNHIPPTPSNIVIRGRKSFIGTPTKLASSIAYPFAFIKPCAYHGDVTLKDINQRILCPSPSKSKENEEDPSIYPTSAFSGKPVVGKAKIRTEGGKGSITIMRTRG